MASIISVAVLAFVLVVIVLPKVTASKDVKIPDVYGMEISKAEDMLKESGFKIDSKKKASDDVDENLVIETEPAKNRYAKKGTTITIYYSSGSEKTEIEDYTGQNAYEVKAKLELLGLTVTIEEKEVENSSDYKDKEQLIIDQSVKAGDKLASGESIILYIPKILTVYPDMVTDGWTLERATEFCEKYGLTIKVTYQETNDVEEGIVLAQSPKAGEEVFENETFKVVISKRQETTTTQPATTTGPQGE